MHIDDGDEGQVLDAEENELETLATPEEGDDEAVSEGVEQIATAMGWAPKDDWKGDQKEWVDASVFLKRGDNIRLSQSSKLKQQGKQIAELQDTVARVAGTVRAVRDQAVAETRAEIRTEMRDAVSSGDTDAFEKAEKKEVDLIRKARAEAAVNTSTNGAAPPDVPEEVQEWEVHNEWFHADPSMRNHAIAHLSDIDVEMPAMSLTDRLAEVTARMKVQFPTKFGAKPPAPLVEGGGRRGGGGNGKGFNALPSEAKKAGIRMVDHDNLFLKGSDGKNRTRSQALDAYASSYSAQAGARKGAEV